MAAEEESGQVTVGARGRGSAGVGSRSGGRGPIPRCRSSPVLGRVLSLGLAPGDPLRLPSPKVWHLRGDWGCRERPDTCLWLCTQGLARGVRVGDPEVVPRGRGDGARPSRYTPGPGEGNRGPRCSALAGKHAPDHGVAAAAGPSSPATSRSLLPVRRHLPGGRGANLCGPRVPPQPPATSSAGRLCSSCFSTALQPAPVSPSSRPSITPTAPSPSVHTTVKVLEGPSAPVFNSLKTESPPSSEGS